MAASSLECGRMGTTGRSGPGRTRRPAPSFASMLRNVTIPPLLVYFLDDLILEYRPVDLSLGRSNGSMEEVMLATRRARGVGAEPRYCLRFVDIKQT
jgi:hypothetical protein